MTDIGPETVAETLDDLSEIQVGAFIHRHARSAKKAADLLEALAARLAEAEAEQEKTRRFLKISRKEGEDALVRVAELEAERQALAEAICGGEDIPGLLASTPVQGLIQTAQKGQQDHSAMIDLYLAEGRRAEAAEAEVARLTTAQGAAETKSLLRRAYKAIGDDLSPRHYNRLMADLERALAQGEQT